MDMIVAGHAGGANATLAVELQHHEYGGRWGNAAPGFSTNA